MSRHAIRQTQRDELAFPIRVKFKVPGDGLGQSMAMHAWLAKACGAGNFASHGARGIGCDAVAYYFRSVASAQAFIDAFPDVELADGTTSAAYQSPAKRNG